MKKRGLVLLTLTNMIQAGSPVWTFTSLTATSISVPSNGTGVIEYTVTNKSKKNHTLAMNTIQGISQDTSGSNCKNPFTLGYQESCTLKLNINGSQLTGNINGGPVVCDQGSQGLQCYQPWLSQQLNIAIGYNEYSLGGAISGLTGTVYLENNNTNQQAFNSNGSFAFTNKLTSGQTYSVTVAAQPNNQICSVANGSGVIASSNITNVEVTCSTNAYTVGGSVSGLTGTVVLQDNGGDNLTINSNGSFAFTTPVANGSPYNVTILTQPAGQTCTVSNGSGIVNEGNITNVDVSCSTNTTTLSMSVSNLALSVNDTPLNAALTGNPRQITIENIGSTPALNLSIAYPTWPSGTTKSSTCGSTLDPSATCVITVTPGSNATSTCNTGIEPIPGVITVSASNVNASVTTSVVVLSYGCQYQGGFLYAVDDTTRNTGSIGGKVATLFDQAAPYIDSGPQATSIIWSSNGTNGTSSNVAYNSIFGISEISTTSSANPNTNQVPGQTACNGAKDGLCNTNNIYVYYQNYATNYPINLSYYAAGLCKQSILGYSDWYLPAMCELDSVKNPIICNAATQSMLVNLGFLIGDASVATPSTSCSPPDGTNCLAGGYWSSTEASNNPQNFAWVEYFSSGAGLQNSYGKASQLGVRCSRALTF